MDKIKVLVIPRNNDTKNSKRIVKPHLFLQDRYNDDFFVDIDFEPDLEDDKYLQQYDIIVYHEYLDEDGTLVDKFKELGIVGVLDIEDAWTLPKNSPYYKYIKHQEDIIKRNIRDAHYVTTSTEPLYDKIKSLRSDDNVFLIPDGIDAEEKQYNLETKPSNKIRLGWVTDEFSMGDAKILEGLVTKLKNEKLMDKVQLVLCGFNLDSYKTQQNQVTGESEKVKRQPKETTWYHYEKILTHDYTTVSEAYRKHLLEFKDEPFSGEENEPYKRVWEKQTNKRGEFYTEFDVALIPMETNGYNETRTPIVMVEAGFYKKPIIAQDFGIHSNSLTNAYERGGVLNLEKNALLVNPKKNHKEWVKYIKKLVQEPVAITTLGENLHSLVSEKYPLSKVNELRKELYQQIKKDKS